MHRTPLALAIGLWMIRANIPFPHEKERWERIEAFNTAPFSLYLMHGLI